MQHIKECKVHIIFTPTFFCKNIEVRIVSEKGAPYMSCKRSVRITEFLLMFRLASWGCNLKCCASRMLPRSGSIFLCVRLHEVPHIRVLRIEQACVTEAKVHNEIIWILSLIEIQVWGLGFGTK